MIIRLLRFVLLFGVGYILYKWLWKGENPWPFKSRKKKDYASAPKAIEEMKKDPVCGTYVPQHEAVKDRVNSTDYYFCSEECKLKFRELQTAKRETSK